MSKARITIVERLYFQPLEKAQPTVTQHQFNRTLLSEDEQPCIRRVMAIEEWKAIDKCWLEQAGTIHILNEAGAERRTIPTEAERQELAQRVVEMSFDGGASHSILVNPGESSRFQPSVPLSQIRYRCRKGEARATLTIFPV